MSSDPIVARRVAAKIADIDVPEEYVMGVSCEVLWMKMVLFGKPTGPNGDSFLVLGELWSNPETLADGLEANFGKQGWPKRIVQVREVDQRTYAIRGEEQPVVIKKGVDEGGNDVVLARAAFSAKSGNNAILMLIAPEEDWDDAEFEALIQSIE